MHRQPGDHPAGDAFYAADKYAEKVNMHIQILCIVLIATVER